ncbi:hypothetical protein F2Q69_00040511 [Brassica cretica]|uniref:Uncharacterized protein n=1 Tax=Brassica cretica TaxID=69181 RepID=A0A8S9N7M6_BRACR|nr:hypothetical protein F2Q69_00040511 [Brassica cretica]
MMSFELMRSEAPRHEDMNTPTGKMNVMDVINPSPNILIPRWRPDLTILIGSWVFAHLLWSVGEAEVDRLLAESSVLKLDLVQDLVGSGSVPPTSLVLSQNFPIQICRSEMQRRVEALVGDFFPVRFSHQQSMAALLCRLIWEPSAPLLFKERSQEPKQPPLASACDPLRFIYWPLTMRKGFSGNLSVGLWSCFDVWSRLHRMLAGPGPSQPCFA